MVQSEKPGSSVSGSVQSVPGTRASLRLRRGIGRTDVAGRAAGNSWARTAVMVWTEKDTAMMIGWLNGLAVGFVFGLIVVALHS